eukprot:1741188-Lingulodinium_polyedra.AAC.1
MVQRSDLRVCNAASQVQACECACGARPPCVARTRAALALIVWTGQKGVRRSRVCARGQGQSIWCTSAC